LSKKETGAKSFIKLSVSISTLRPKLEGLGLDDCNTKPPWGDSAENYKYYGMRTIEEARDYHAGILRGQLQVKVKGLLYDSWRVADIEYNSATHEFSSIDRKGGQQRVENCWVVDVSFGSQKDKRVKHRFDVVSKTQSICMAAEDFSSSYTSDGTRIAGDQIKKKWLAVMACSAEEMSAEQKKIISAAIGAGRVVAHTMQVQ
jgi:hypothetical protein